jgi:hypothetical protein
VHAPQGAESGSSSARAVIGAITKRALVADGRTESVMPYSFALAIWVKVIEAQTLCV